MKRILIIGEYSYIGTSFREYAAEYAPEMKVDVISARNQKWKEADFSAYDSILHVAAIVHQKESSLMQQIYQEVNTEIPVEVAQRAKTAGVRQFVFLSTMAVYGECQSLITEEIRPSPVTMYGKSKLFAEQQLESLAGEGFSVIIVRPPMVYGRSCPGNYGRLAGMAEKLPFFPKINNQRSMIYIENLCACIHHEMESLGESYRIVCPQNAEYVNTTELVKQIRKAHNKKTLLIPFPQFVVQSIFKKNKTLWKVFGNYCYEHKKEEKDYQTVDFNESIVRTEMRWMSDEENKSIADK